MGTNRNFPVFYLIFQFSQPCKDCVNRAIQGRIGQLDNCHFQFGSGLRGFAHTGQGVLKHGERVKNLRHRVAGSLFGKRFRVLRITQHKIFAIIRAR